MLVPVNTEVSGNSDFKFFKDSERRKTLLATRNGSQDTLRCGTLGGKTLAEINNRLFVNL